MKNRQVKISFTLALSVLLSILLQSIHSYEHFEKALTQKKCFHKFANSKEITHQHTKLEHCSVCQFTYGNYVTPEFFTFLFQNDFELTRIFFSDDKEIFSFSGSLITLRGPPNFIV